MSSTTSTTTSRTWIPLGDTVIDHRPIYTFPIWPHSNHDHLHIAISISGSFIATCRNDHKPFFVLNAKSMAVPLSIHRANGVLLKSISWTRELASIFCIGWTDSEMLVTVLDDGTVRIYPLFGDPTIFSLGEEVQSSGIISCKIIPSGLAVLTVSGIYVVVRSWRNPIAREYSHYHSPQIPKAWTLISESVSFSNSVEILVGTSTGLITVSEIDSCEWEFPSCKYFCLSPTAQFVAIISDKYILGIHAISSKKEVAFLALTTVLTELQVDLQLAWCGNEVIVLASSEAIVFLHISGEHYVIDLIEPIYMSESWNTIFALSVTGLSMLHIVPYPVLNAFQIGSTHSIAMLMDALSHYTRNSPQAVDILEFLLKSNTLTTALNVGIEAASYAWDVNDQRTLLSAVQFGRAWQSIGSIDPNENNANQRIEIRDNFISTAQKLRVLNTARNLGFPITKDMLKELGDVPGFIRLLIRARNHELAIRSADLLRLNNVRSQIVLDWARLHLSTCSYENVDQTVQNVFNRVLELNLDSPVDWSSLALSASQVGRTEVAAKVLDFETNLTRQVPLLLDLHQSSLALARAVESFDRDLVRAVSGAYSYFEQYARENDWKLLRDSMSLEDSNTEIGYLILEESATSEMSVEEKNGLLREALHSFSRAKSTSWEQQLVEQQLQLVHLQAQLTETLPIPTVTGLDWVNLSSVETINQLIIKNRVANAKTLKADLKIGDKLWTWCLIRGLCRARDWAELEGFVLSKRPVIGYLPVVKECLSMGAPSEALKYIIKCDIRTRFSLYIKAGAVKEAAQVALGLRDMSSLIKLRQNQPEEIRIFVDEKITQLRMELN